MRTANNLTVAKTKALSRPGRHSDGVGLYLNVKPGGTKSWLFMYVRNGKRHELGLGAFPAVSLAEARTRAALHRATLASRSDPRAIARNKARPTFGAVVDAYIEAYAPSWRNVKHAQQWRNMLSTYCAKMSDRHVDQIGLDDVLGTLAPIWREKAETASRVRSRIERIIDFAAARGWRAGENPARWKGHLAYMLPARDKLARGHHGAMRYRDVPAFLAPLRASEGVAARPLEFTILTTARTGEVIGATWSEVNVAERIWCVPAGRMKAGREHRVALSTPALAVLDGLAAARYPDAPDGGFVFPGLKSGEPLSNITIEVVLRRLGEKANGVTVHGFRSSFRDWAGEKATFPREVAEAALAHVVGDATERAYRRGDALERRRELMAAWGGLSTGRSMLDGHLLTDDELSRRIIELRARLRLVQRGHGLDQGWCPIRTQDAATKEE